MVKILSSIEDIVRAVEEITEKLEHCKSNGHEEGTVLNVYYSPDHYASVVCGYCNTIYERPLKQEEYKPRNLGDLEIIV